MFERFTERARVAVVCAQDEARELKHEFIAAEHLLLGLLREERGLAARVLEQLDVTLEECRAHVLPEGAAHIVGQIPFTARARKVFELALREALALGHNYIGTEHLLLGLVREDHDRATFVLSQQGVTAEAIRERVLRELKGETVVVSEEAVSEKSAIALLDEQIDSYDHMLGLLTQQLAPVLRPREVRPTEDERAWQESGLRERIRTLAALNNVLRCLLDEIDL